MYCLMFMLSFFFYFFIFITNNSIYYSIKIFLNLKKIFLALKILKHFYHFQIYISMKRRTCVTYYDTETMCGHSSHFALIGED